MISFRIELFKVIDEDLAADIEKESVYVSPFLRQLRVTADRTAVEVEISESVSENQVRSKVNRYLEAMLSRFRKIESKVHLRNERHNQKPFTLDVYNELKKRGWLFELGPGYIGLTGPALMLMNTIDETFTKLYRESFGALDCMYPTFVKPDLLARCGYFESHPNTVSMVTHLINDFDAIEQFRQENLNGGELQISNSDMLATPHVCLNPAACFPCYQSLEGQTVGESGCVRTWQGRVFRYESKNVTGLERLWEFNVRELVFIGTDEFVTAKRSQVLELIVKQIAEWDLECQIETATDVFFATVSAAKMFWQQSLEVKYEIRLAIEQEKQSILRSVAGGSINMHGNFFGTKLNITAADGHPAFTACVGLGLERWVLAIFAQHGFNPDGWPAFLRTRVFE
jgi:seryl-tRNA synthetase